MSPAVRQKGKAPAIPEGADLFNPKMFEAFKKDVESGRFPVKRPMISDGVVKGLRALFRDTGGISFHVHYQANDNRALIKIGDYPDMSIERARKIAKTVIGLGKSGIDIQEALHQKLIRELERDGMKWKP